MLFAVIKMSVFLTKLNVDVINADRQGRN